MVVSRFEKLTVRLEFAKDQNLAVLPKAPEHPAYCKALAFSLPAIWRRGARLSRSCHGYARDG